MEKDKRIKALTLKKKDVLVDGVNGHIVRYGKVSNILGDSVNIQWEYLNHQLNPHRVTEILGKSYVERAYPWDEKFGAWVHRQTEKSAYREQVMREGFYGIHTGGGCTAFLLNLPGKRYCMVTDNGGGREPRARHHICYFGIYKQDLGEELFSFSGPFKLALDGGIDWKATFTKKKLVLKAAAKKQ